jgi:hypothetical protein
MAVPMHDLSRPNPTGEQKVEINPPTAEGRYAAKLSALGFEVPERCIPPSEELVCQFEQRFQLKLPADFRKFLAHHGGAEGGALCVFQEPTPCGKATYINCFYGFRAPEHGDDIATLTEYIDGAPDVIAIGANLMGAQFWLKCTGADAGSIHMHDHEQRSAWSDEEFLRSFPNLGDEINEYLKLRKAGKLPAKLRGYEHVYRLARSFDEFVNSLQPPPLEPQRAQEDERDHVPKAIASCDDEFLHELIASNRLDQPVDYDRSAIHVAAGCRGSIKAMRWLLAAGAKPDGALCAACHNGMVQHVEFLLKENLCSVEERRLGMTPIMWAVDFPYELENHLRVVSLLLARGADVNVRSTAGNSFCQPGQSVLQIAGGRPDSAGRTRGSAKLLDLLKNAGATLDP